MADLKEIFLNYGINIEAEKEEKLLRFEKILSEYNSVMNLTAVKGERETHIKHFLDSALGLKFFEGEKNCCEIGSGGGFPSVVLKILNDDLKFTLVESTGKKCEYLKDVVRELDLKNVEVICARAEDLAKDDKYREKYDIVTARAVARMNTLCEYCIPFCKVGGRFVAYKGEDENEIKEAENSVKTLGGSFETKEKFSLPDGMGIRNIVVIRKDKNTPEKYPRGNGKERKNPL